MNKGESWKRSWIATHRSLLMPKRFDGLRAHAARGRRVMRYGNSSGHGTILRICLLASLTLATGGCWHGRNHTITGTPPEFLLLLCPLVYPGVTMCPASNGDAVKMWCYGRLRGLFRRVDSPCLQFAVALNPFISIVYVDSMWGIHSPRLRTPKFLCSKYLRFVEFESPVNPRLPSC